MTAASESPEAFAVWFKDLDRWSVSSFSRLRWKWPRNDVKPLSSALERKRLVIDKEERELEDLCLVTLHFDGEMEPRRLRGKTDFKGTLFLATAGDVVYSKIDVRNGAIGVVPSSMPEIAVSSEYPVYHVRPEVGLPEYIQLVFRTDTFCKQINSMISGATGRKRVQPRDLEEISVPLPALPVQNAIVDHWQTAQAAVSSALDSLREQTEDLDRYLRQQADMSAFEKSSFAVPWREITSWDTKAARAALFRLRNPSFRPLAEFAEEATELVRPWEAPDHDWPVYGVNNKDGVFFSHRQKGRDFNAAYKRIRKDWFFHNPTRSNVGSLGIVPDVPEDAITSPEYQVWRIEASLLPGFVALLIGTSFFIELVQVHRVGAVKQRLYVQNLLQIPIPVVPGGKQAAVAQERERLLAAFDEAKGKAARARAEVEEMIVGVRPV